jgi:hypothetical protein
MKLLPMLFLSGVSIGTLTVPLRAQLYSFDPTGSVNTEPISINPSGAITGFYEDASNVTHGFAGRVPLTP